MNFTSLDLNLLVALDALLREASVSRAAMRIGLPQCVDGVTGQPRSGSRSLATALCGSALARGWSRQMGGRPSD